MCPGLAAARRYSAPFTDPIAIRRCGPLEAPPLDFRRGRQHNRRESTIARRKWTMTVDNFQPAGRIG